MGEEILRQFGYASGVYLNNCGLCEETFTGDRRSVVCESCALRLKKAGMRREHIFGK